MNSGQPVGCRKSGIVGENGTMYRDRVNDSEADEACWTEALEVAVLVVVTLSPSSNFQLSRC